MYALKWTCIFNKDKYSVYKKRVFMSCKSYDPDQVLACN